MNKRPSDASKIKFTKDCFEQVGTKTVYRTLNPLGVGYPKFFDTLEAAQDYTKNNHHEIVESTTPILKRVKWF